jgi:UDP-N-acetylmuramoyl-tripeptide--D-alanyl-D-alanine ligase
MLWTGRQIAQAVGGSLEGDFSVSGIGIDSRALQPGDLFVALAAERDGHDFLAAARAAGAAGALVSRQVRGPHVRVADTLAALQDLARAARERAPAVRRGAVTGSVGKTSVTQAVLAGLKAAGRAHGSTQSFNNHIGVPLTLARMPPATERAVFEMGMNHPGEIAPLTRLVGPHAVAVTNVEAVHVENFADGEGGVARAKAEIFEGLQSDGVAVLNADSRWFGFLADEAAAAGARVVGFGRTQGAAARLVDFAAAPEGAIVTAQIFGRELRYPLAQTAAHWGPMSLCALMLLEALEVDRDVALAALGALEPLAGRGAVRSATLAGGGAFTLVDESYNASPVSVAAALENLGRQAASGRRIAVLTDMLELGPDSPDRHAGLAEEVDHAGVDVVFCAGDLMRHLFDAVPARRRGAWAPSAEALIPTVREAISPGDVVMVKGSKASHAWKIAAALQHGGDA